MAGNATRSRSRAGWRRWLSGIVVGITPWLLSFVLHGAGIIGLGLLSGDAPGTSRERLRSVDIVLADGYRSALGDSSTETTMNVSLVSYTAFAAVPESNAPPLLAEAAPTYDRTPPAEFHPPSQTRAITNSEAIPPGDAADSGQRPGIETQLFGIAGRGNRFVYVFDRSASMEGRALAAAKRELVTSVQALQPANQFQVIFYNQEPHLMPPLRGARQAMTSADELGKRLAANFIGSIYADGPTNHLAALKVALELRPDVIFFLTDAEEPQLGADDFLRIRQLNRKTTIHAIEFGAGPSKNTWNFLQHLAMENGGQHTYIDVSRLPGPLR